MPNYLFLLHEDPAAFAKVSPEEMQSIIQKYSGWKQKMQTEGVLRAGAKLQEGTGRVLRGNGKNGNGTAITDGPYTESKEVIGGLFEVQAADYQAAVEIARGCPHLEFGAIEIREIEIQ